MVANMLKDDHEPKKPIEAGKPSVGQVPRHIAIIMDGNGRWASSRQLSRVRGHTEGVEAVRATVKACVSRGVEYLTLFAFSSENWARPPAEIRWLFQLFLKAIEREIDRLHKTGVRVKIVGDCTRFPPFLIEAIERIVLRTAENTQLTLTICANYGGRWDILQALAALQSAGHQGGITEDDINHYLSMSYAPEPDLFIRTGGEQRVSNFLLWQMAYTELYFTDTFWPDFNGDTLDLAIASYQKRERRFGRTSEQVQEANTSL